MFAELRDAVTMKGSWLTRASGIYCNDQKVEWDLALAGG